MLFDKFVEETRSWWDRYFLMISKGVASGHVRTASGGHRLDGDSGYKILYPNMMVVTNCSGYYIAELIGAVEVFTGVAVKRSKEKSVYKYFSQFDDSDPVGVFILGGKNSRVSGLCLIQNDPGGDLNNRFLNLDLYGAKVVRANGHGSPLGFSEDFESSIVDDCVLVNSSGAMRRCKSILYAAIVRSSISKSALVDLFNVHYTDSEVAAVHSVSFDEERIVVGGQLQSLTLFPSLHETSIGDFLKMHPKIMETAFNSTNVLYEPYLTWEEHDGTCEDVAINPDMLVRRDDGYYDIYDLKTALLDRRRITKSSRSRRRFIDYVEEGLAQLANYEEYFSYDRNRQHAKQKYGVEVKNPNLVLVVGSWENVDPVEVRQACRKHHDRVSVIDYDTLSHMFMGVKDVSLKISQSLPNI